ncbi:MAG TPA: VCBS repeat-containing protein [Pseudacidobacterium sp.]|jgi:hypothetical protein|nr:VCBS repeat-containing protein [Pseudacidobacterium sp.]
MIRTLHVSLPLAPILATISVVAMLASVFARAEDADEASGLTVISDFNRDGVADIAKVTLPDAHSGPGNLTVLLGQADGTFKQTASTQVIGNDPRSIVAGDFNQDGIPDLIVGDNDGTLLLFLGDGTGNMIPTGAIAHLDSVVSIAMADFNHDGIPDIAVSDWRSSSVTVLLGNGNGSFRETWSFPLRMRGTNPHLAAADFNGDGIPDLAVVYDDDDGDTFDVMLSNGNGTFTAAPDRSLVKDPNAHCVT